MYVCMYVCMYIYIWDDLDSLRQKNSVAAVAHQDENKYLPLLGISGLT